MYGQPAGTYDLDVLVCRYYPTVVANSMLIPMPCYCDVLKKKLRNIHLFGLRFDSIDTRLNIKFAKYGIIIC